MEARVSAYSVERDPNLIILRYRKRADEYRALAATDDGDREGYLDMAAIYDRLERDEFVLNRFGILESASF